MAFPADVKLVSVTCGTGYDFSGDPIAITLEVTPVLGGSLKRLIHAATGTFMTRDALTFKSDPGSPATFTVPSPAQADTWKDGSGAFFTNWSYSVTVTTRTASGKTQSWIQSFQPVDGQETVDLDLVPDGQIGSPTSAPAPAVTSVNGQSGAVVIDGGEAVTPESVAANLTVEAVDAKLPARLSESALSAATDEKLSKAVKVFAKPNANEGNPYNVILGGDLNGSSMNTSIGTSVILNPGNSDGNQNVIGGDGSTTVGTTAANVPTEGINANVSVVGGYDNVAGAISSKIISDHSYTAVPTTGLGHHGIFGGQGHVAGPKSGHAGIIGGSRVTVDSKGSFGTGYDNKTEGDNTLIGGDHNTIGPGGDNGAVFGRYNTLDAAEGCVLGGYNSVSGVGSLVSGFQNTSAARYSLVAGANNSTTTIANGAVVGGENNAVNAGYGMAAGLRNTVSGLYSTAAGYLTEAPTPHQRAYGAGAWGTETVQGGKQHSQFVVFRQSTDATTGNLGTTDTGSAPPVIPANSAWMFEANVVAQDTTTGDTAAWTVTGAAKRIGTGAPVLVGTPTVVKVAADTGSAAWAVTASVHAAGALTIRSTGEAGKTIRWVGNISATQVKMPVSV